MKVPEVSNIRVRNITTNIKQPSNGPLIPQLCSLLKTLEST